ncbi:hypothetical protein HOY80DRAFT_995965 [Tuber brumale]|nr:hypothetical protein HOY80DRAFT_995965 [Tuber brumale]
MAISCALLKHGYQNFSLEILKYCEVSELIKREKDLIELFNSEYNIVKDPTKNPMFGRKHSDETRQKMSYDRTGSKRSDETRKKNLPFGRKKENSSRFKPASASGR